MLAALRHGDGAGTSHCRAAWPGCFCVACHRRVENIRGRGATHTPSNGWCSPTYSVKGLAFSEGPAPFHRKSARRTRRRSCGSASSRWAESYEASAMSIASSNARSSTGFFTHRFVQGPANGPPQARQAIRVLKCGEDCLWRCQQDEGIRGLGRFHKSCCTSRMPRMLVAAATRRKQRVDITAVRHCLTSAVVHLPGLL
jgi:hypothetical protein